MKDIDINAASGVVRQAKFFPDHEALVYGDRTWTYAQLVEEIRVYAKALVASGVKENDRVAYLGLNSANFLIINLATWWVGAVYEPLNFRLAPLEVEDLVKRSRPKVLIVENGHQEVIELIPSLDQLRETTGLIMVDNDQLAPIKREVPEYFQMLSVFLAAGGGAGLGDPVARHESDLGILMFTSGTTGVPKGVQLTHGNV